MPGYVLTFASVVMCSHGGQGKPIPPIGAVMVRGQGVVTTVHQYAIVGCPLPAALAGPPCVTGQFLTGSTRVFSRGKPVCVPLGGTSLCKPNPVPLLVAPAGQMFVYAGAPP